jgi:hypothetical protein
MRGRLVSQRLVAGLVLLSFSRSCRAGETTLLDLSYRPHVDAASLANVIHAHVPGESAILMLDISNSVLGDKGLKEVRSALLSSGADTKKPKGSLHLTARTNELTPQGVASLVDSLLESRSNANATATDDELTGAHGPRLSLKSLDLGWNHLHPERPGQKGFLKALQQLVVNM